MYDSIDGTSFGNLVNLVCSGGDGGEDLEDLGIRLSVVDFGHLFGGCEEVLLD